MPARPSRGGQHEPGSHEPSEPGAVMSPVSPATKAARHAQIVSILEQTAVRSQEELADWLAHRGVRVTQTTLSRDLEELGAVRLRGTGGALVYALPGRAGRPRVPARRPGREPHRPDRRGRERRRAARGRPRAPRPAGPGRGRAACFRRGQRQPGHPAHAGRRRAVPRLRHRPRQMAVDPRHSGRGRHRARDRAGSGGRGRARPVAAPARRAAELARSQQPPSHRTNPGGFQ